MKPRFRAEWVVVSEELLILGSCLLRYNRSIVYLKDWFGEVRYFVAPHLCCVEQDYALLICEMPAVYEITVNFTHYKRSNLCGLSQQEQNQK